MSGPAWLARAHEEMGVEEIDGAEASPRIMEYFAAAPGSGWVKDDGVPWCGAFMAWLMEAHGPLPPEPLRARSWLAWGEPLDEPIPGCVVILKRGSNPKAGHVALFQQWSKDRQHVYLLGGNQGNRVSIARFKTADVLGYRWPRGAKVVTGSDLANGSRIKKEARDLVGVGGATVATGVAGQTIPAPPDISPVTAWQPFIQQVSDFLSFMKANWMVAAGVLVCLAGVRIYRWRTQDAKEGKSWVY